MEASKEPLLVIRTAIQDEQNRVLLVRREPLAGYNAGLFEFPGGQVEVGETIEAAQLREIHEETGYAVDPTSSPVLIGNRTIPDGPYKGRLYMMLCGSGDVAEGEMLLSQEHSEGLWVPPSLELVPQWQLTRETVRAAQILGQLSLIRR